MFQHCMCVCVCGGEGGGGGGYGCIRNNLLHLGSRGYKLYNGEPCFANREHEAQVTVCWRPLLLSHVVMC